MTTAHRPTFDPARGKDTLRGPAYHQRLLPAHTHLKVRQAGQGGAADAAPRDLRADLLRAEAAVKARQNGGEALIENTATADDSRSTKRKLIDHQPQNHDLGSREEVKIEDQGEDAESKRRRVILEEAHAIDADSDGANASASEDSSSDEDDEDEEAELHRELAKIRAERAAARAAEDAEKAKKEQEAREVEIARGNPLLNGDAGGGGGVGMNFGVKRRWDDDVVFRNQARGTEEKGKRKEFVNDLLRSDFHKRFMSKYVR